MLGDNAFGGSVKDIKVPLSSIAAYRQAEGWKNFTNYYGGDVVNNGITYRIDDNSATITAAEATLTEANIPSAVEFEGNQHPVKKINDEVFFGNANLIVVTLPESLTTLGREAFSFCKSLKTIKIPSGVTAIPGRCFYGCSSLESVTIPEGVTAIVGSAFEHCKLNVLTLPESLEAIGRNAFSGNDLKSVNIPTKVKTIEEHAFSYCGLTDLVIQEGVQTIDNEAFLYNNNLQSIICNAVTPPTLGDNAFDSSIKPDVKVPLASIVAYRQTVGWKNFTNYYGEEVIADGITYWINEKEAVVAAADSSLTEANIPSVVEFEGNQYPVIKINDKVFFGNANLIVVTLPESLTTLGGEAFRGCQSLKIVKIPSKVTAIPDHCFEGCSSLESVTIPDGVTTIGTDAFYKCKNLESVALPESLTTLGSRSFEFCKSLKTIKIPSGVTTIPFQCFNGCSSLESIAIPEGVTDIGNEAFSGCNLNALTLPESLVKIGSWAFYYNRSLKSINIPAKVKTIEEWAFTYCGLTELVIPEGVTTIGQKAFFNNSLQKLTLPSTITSIGESAFYDNNRFLSIICNAATPPTLGADVFGRSITTSIKVPMASIAAYRQAEGWKNFINYYGGEMISDGITYWFNEKEAMVAVAEAALTEANIPSAVEFEGNRCQVIKINDKVFSGNTNLTTVSLPDNLVEIGAFAFNECKNLASVALPESLTTLGDRAFYACKSLKTIKIPSGITIIPDSCFYECSSLESVTIPEGVTAVGGDALRFCNFNALTLPESLEKIGSHAFDGNKSLKSVNIPAKVKTIEERAFSFCGLTELVIPEGVLVIDQDAFLGNSLKNLTLPSTITSIGESAFRYNNDFQSIICNAATPPALGANAFDGEITPDVKVPLSSIAAYRQADGWKNFTNYYGGEMIADGITYRINEKKEAMVAAAETSLTEANIPSAVEFEGNRCQVIKINDKVFSGNTNLTTVSLPENLVEIGTFAFNKCKNLASVTLPESLTTVGNYAFNDCRLLKAIKIPSKVTAIPCYCFNACSSLESVTIPEGVTTIGSFAFQSCNLNALTLPESLEAIESSAFSGNQSLKSVNIPAKVKTIGAWAFYGCGLKDLVIQEGVQTIGNYAFFNNSLQNLTLPSTITSIGKEAFNCYSGYLQSITCNAATPPTLGDNAFSSGIMPSIKVPLASIAAYRQADGWKNISEYYVYEVISDGVTYRIDDKAAYVRAVDKTVSEICLAENVAFEGAQYPLYKIADKAFAGNGSITLVTVPATVEAIGSNAFDGVTYPIIKIKATTPPVLASKLPMLSAIVPPESVKAYKAANYWKEMTIIGEGKNDIEVTTSATVDLTEAIMTQAKITPASVTSIKVHGPLTNDDIINALNTNMRSCYAIDLSDAEIEALPDGAFNGKIGLLEITLPAGLKAIGNNAFRGCFAMRNEVTIPAGVQTIGSYAFSGCRNAKFNPALPETLTAIGDYAFQNCANLYAVTLPASLQTIGEYAFYASSIQEIVLPEGLFSLGDGAFWFCKALETADFMNSMEIISIPSNAFNGCSGLRKVYLPFFVEEIGDYAFSGCKSLKSLNFFECEEITKIGEFAFRGCRSLKSLDLFKCENLTTIGSRAFSGCTSLKSLNLPKSLETIGEYAFSGCQAISVISSPSLVPPTIASESALNGIDKDVCVLTMPKSVYLDYFRAPYWGQFVEYTASVLVGVDGQGSVMYSNNYGTAPTPVKVAVFYATAGEGVEEDEGDGITAEAYDSANICAKDNSTLTFRIVPDEGNEIKSVTYAGEDVTAQVVDGLFTTPVINGDTNLDVSFVASTDYIAIPVSAVSKGAEVVVPVELVNTTEVMGIECKVQIPEGFSVAKKADGSLKVEQTERKADQTLTVAVDGNVLTVKTSGTQAYTGNTGAVFTIAIAPDEATAPADYVLKVTDVKFVNATGVASRPDAKTTLTLRDYVLGDVDSDQLVAINDAVIVMNHIVGADTPAFNAKAADMDGNGSVEINDAVLIMNTVVGTESTKSIKKTSATEPNADELTAADIEICQGGTAMLSLDLANLDALTAAQFEITLPEGITAGKAEAGERASRHMIKTNMVGNVLKVAMLSAESADFDGSEGVILVLPLSADKTMPSGSYGISLRNVKMSDARGNLFILPDADSSVVVKDWSGVDSVAFDRLRVYGGNGEICIESPADTVIQIVAVDGRAFAVEASAGKTAVAVNAGVYVVNGQKVIVK